MTRKRTVTILSCTAIAIFSGCKKTDDSRANFTKALNTYYAAQPACLWPDPIKLPVQADTSDTAKTSGYDALVDQGLLARTTAEKKVFIIASKQVTNYDLSDKGRQAWAADQTQPGFGNFCYGTPAVSAIDSYTPTNDQPGATTIVNYHTSLSGTPAWATAAETQNAFPQLRSQLGAPVPVTSTLENTSSGWVVRSGLAPRKHTLPTSADSSIVQ